MTGKTIEMTASDGHHFSAYRADPQGTPKGGVIIIQEIFGVNAHIRSVADQYAAAGYVTIAPAIFDRIERDFEVGYEGADRDAAFAMFKKFDPMACMLDVAATAKALKDTGKVAIVGYCLGGSMAFLAASQVPEIDVAVGYYGSMIANHLDKAPKVPTMLHFGDQDHSIPMDKVEAVKAAFPDMPIYVYHAGHGFNRDVAPSYDAPSAKLAFERTLAFIEKA